MSFPVQNSIVNNPFTGVFGNGQIQMFPQSGTFTVPIGVSKVRVRIWGGGGNAAGGGGGFAMKVCDVSPAQAIAVTTGGSAQASSFGSFVSATAGVTSAAGGIGVGGDVNYQGGLGGTAGGGAANIFGNGGNRNSSGASGGGQSANGLQSGGSGFGSTGGFQNGTANDPKYPPTTLPITSIDFIGTGGGGGYSQHGVNGGGDGASAPSGVASFPAAGGASSGGRGLVILEY